MIWTIENGFTRSGPALVEHLDAGLERLQAADAGRDGRADAVGLRRDVERRSRPPPAVQRRARDA